MMGNHDYGITMTPNITTNLYSIPGTIFKPLRVNFYDASDKSLSSWAWNFGEGSSNATHSCSIVSDYTLKFAIRNGN
ncbi:hypothetical protein [Methanospirillum lacunae]|uniref:PKD domain-containing protein n=1 Tax=Methanospirillum lacunae TaxID=668570 RepID=A0A2V2NBC1_9EURY|nr:hypothetical protein DK846_07950 [Methanospirillum lacunae]